MGNNFFSLPIRIHLMILISFLSLPFIILIIYSGVVERNEAIENAKNGTTKFIDIIAYQQQYLVAGVEQLATALSFLPEIHTRRIAETNSLLGDLVKKNPQYTNIALMDTNGFIWGSAIKAQKGVSLADRRYFKETVRTGKFSSGEFTIGRLSKKPIMNFGYPVKDASNRLIGIIGIAFDLNYVRQYFKNMNLPSGASFSVLDRRGITLYTNLGSENAGTPPEKSDIGREIFDKVKVGHDEGTLEAVGNDGTPSFFAYRKLSIPNESEPYLYVVSSVPYSSAASRANAEMIHNMAILMSFFVAGLLLVWFMGKRFIVTPIRLLRRAAQQLSAGADVVNISSVVRGGEFGELARAFEKMAQALVQREIEKNAAEASLRESEGKFRDLAEKSMVGINLIQGGIIRYANDKAADMFGYKVDEMVDRVHLEDLFVPEDIPGARESIRRHVTGEIKSAKYGWRMRTRSGETIYTEAYVTTTAYKGRPAIITSVLDITDRKRAEDELRRVSIALEQAAEDIVITDTEGVIQYVNPAFEKITGYTRQEVIGKTPRILTSGVHNADFYKELWDTIKEGNVWTGRFTNKRKDGHFIQEDATISPLLSSTGKLTGFVSLKRDVTEEVKLETQFFRAQKMEAVGALASGIAHDFNNILSGILGHSTMLQFDTRQDDPHFKRLRDIENLVMSGAGLTRQLLGFARGGQYELTATNINELVEKTSEMFGRTEKGITCSTTFQRDIWTVDADRGQLEQVLLNMYINAAQAMSKEGNIYLETKNVELREIDVRPHGVKAGRYAMVSVTDTGIGMDKTILEKIFEPFFTTKEPGKGTGLGLTSAYGIIKNHEGFINVYSETGRGTTFKIYLPASETRGEIVGPKTDLMTMLKGHETILIVDDEPLNISLIQEILKKLEYRVFTAGGGEEAVKIYREHGKKIDLVILDMIMPEMSGRKVFEILRTLNPDVKILLSSGYSLNGEAQTLINEGCNGFIQKPFRIQELSNKIREIL